MHRELLQIRKLSQNIAQVLLFLPPNRQWRWTAPPSRCHKTANFFFPPQRADLRSRQIVGDRHISIIEKCHKLLLLLQRIPDCIFQLAALFRVQRFQLREILLQKGPNHILAAILTAFLIRIYVFLLQRKQQRTVLESHGCLAGFHSYTIRHGFPPFASGMGPAATVCRLLHLVIALRIHPLPGSW